MNELTQEEVSRRRRGEWRNQIRAAVADISLEIANGLFCHFKSANTIKNACVLLKSSNSRQRNEVWRAAFPGIADVVEIAWAQLDPEVIAHRDGGASGRGSRFRWKLDCDEADHFLFEWLRKLLIVAGPFPELNFVSVVENVLTIAGGSAEEFVGDYFENSCGHCYDVDAIAYAACALFESKGSLPVAKNVEDVMLAQLRGQTPVRSFRHIQTSFLCGRRPDLWAKLDHELLDSGREAGFRSYLLANRHGTHPDAFLHLMRTIRDGELVRLREVDDAVRGWFGLNWRWPDKDRDAIQEWLIQWVEILESQSVRENVLSKGEPGPFAMGLWAKGLVDGDGMIDLIREPASLKPELRVAAAHILGLCPGKRRAKIVVDYATDLDPRVAAVASDLLLGEGSALPTTTEVPDLASRLTTYLTRLPEKPKIHPAPFPFPDRRLNTEALIEVVANRFPDGDEAVIESLLPRMSANARDRVVTRLNRYNQTEFDREIAEITHSGDPERLADWIADTGGQQKLAQRHLLLKMLGDRSYEVAEHAYRAVKRFSLTRSEFELVRPTLSSKSAKKRLLVINLLESQPEELVCALVPVLLTSRNVNERLAALEVLRVWGEDENRKAIASLIWESREGYEARTLDEERALELFLKATGRPEIQELPATLENAFGLVDLDAFVRRRGPGERRVMLWSATTQLIVNALDDWLSERSEWVIDNPNRWSNTQPEKIRFAEFSFSGPSRTRSREENLANFPQVEALLEWWSKRGGEFRDADGFELLRVRIGLKDFGRLPPEARRILFDGNEEPSCKHRRYILDRLVDWLLFAEGEPTGGVRFLADAAETVTARLPEKLRNWAHFYYSMAIDRAARRYDGDKETAERLWCWTKPSPGEGRQFGYFLWDVLKLLVAGVATEDDLIWYLLGGKQLDGYSKDRAFNDLAAFTEARPRSDLLKSVEIEPVRERVRNRILELELTRGESEEPFSVAAASISSVPGSDWLIRFLRALGKEKLNKTRGHKGSYTRPSVLNHLIEVSCPVEGETPQIFTDKVKSAGIPHERLVELAMFAPRWVKHVGLATGVHGLSDAVGWIFAHTRTTDSQWQANAKELWEGELNFRTPIKAEEFLAGAVDVGWFQRAYHAIDSKTWNRLYEAAKFASSGKGHVRARLFADALLGQVSVEELITRLEDQGNLDAAVAIGLPPLGKGRDDDLLRRYEILQALKRRSRKSKAQRRASEESAFRIGLQNLARSAGYVDTVRFEWVMETKASEDLSDGALCTEADGVQLEIVVSPAGDLEMRASRDGVALRSIPSALGRLQHIQELKSRMAELRGQSQRLRPALEDLMTRGVKLASFEWQRISRHPLAGSLLSRLVIADDSAILGYPNADGITGVEGKIPWPEGEAILHLAHPVDFLPAHKWSCWQRDVFDRRLVQPFKQVFRELYVPTAQEGGRTEVSRYRKQQVNTHRAFALLTGRSWVHHPERGLARVFREEGISASIDFEECFYHPREIEVATVDRVTFLCEGKALTCDAVPKRIFSEVLRDLDLIVSVAHATGADPEASVSTVASRAAIVRETCRMLDLRNVDVEGNFVSIRGSLSDYRIHLASGVVHRVPGQMIAVIREGEPERGRLFLPFADDDPQSADVLTRVILFASDEKIKDPAIAAQIRK